MTRPYVSIDIETTGLDWRNCQTIQIGAVIDNWETPIDQMPTFNCYIDHGTFKGEPYALSMHAEIFRAISEARRHRWQIIQPDIYVVTPDAVAHAFYTWLDLQGLNPRLNRIVVAGKNFGAFDKDFLEDLPAWKDLVKMKHRIIDPGNMYYVPGVDDELPDTAECLRRAKLPPVVNHKALDDAFDVVRLIRWKRDNG